MKEYKVFILSSGKLKEEFLNRFQIATQGQSFNVDDVPVQFEILEMDASPQSVGMRDLYFKQAQCFILLYSITASSTFTDIPDFVEQLWRVRDEEDCPMVLVALHASREDDRVVKKEQGQQLCQSLCRSCVFREIDLKEEEVKEIFTVLTRQLRGSPNSGADSGRRGGGKKAKCHVM